MASKKTTRKDKSILLQLAALAVGTGLIVFPEPATTALGTLVVLSTLGLAASEGK